MPYFSRRQIHMMLCEISTEIQQGKLKDLIGKLNSKRPDQVLGAEMELAFSYAFRCRFVTQIEPDWFPGSRNPDLYIEDFFDTPAIVEITAISDEMLSDENKMRYASQKISQYVNTLKRGAGKRLFFEFQEENGYRPTVPSPINSIFGHTQYFRKRLVPKKFQLCNEFKQLLNIWILSHEWLDGKALRVTLDYVDVVIRVRDYDVTSTHNFFSSMPAECYDLNKNPIVNSLKNKEKQLSQTPDGILRIIILASGGCRLLRDLRHQDTMNRTFNGDQIIRNYLGKGSKIDHVFVISPDTVNEFFNRQSYKIWRVAQYNGLGREGADYRKKTMQLMEKIPPPRYSDYNAKNLQIQGQFKPNHRGQTLGTTFTFNFENEPVLQMKTSAKVLYELISGRINFEEFEKLTGMREGLLKDEYRISEISLESKSPLEDDDVVVISFSKDPAASRLSLKDITKLQGDG